MFANIIQNTTLPYFKVNIYPFPLPHFASIFFAYLWSFRWPNYIVTLPRYFSFRLPHLNISTGPPSDELDKTSQRAWLSENLCQRRGHTFFEWNKCLCGKVAFCNIYDVPNLSRNIPKKVFIIQCSTTKHVALPLWSITSDTLMSVFSRVLVMFARTTHSTELTTTLPDRGAIWGLTGYRKESLSIDHRGRATCLVVQKGRCLPWSKEEEGAYIFWMKQVPVRKSGLL
jgi:hypothetical protein